MEIRQRLQVLLASFEKKSFDGVLINVVLISGIPELVVFPTAEEFDPHEHRIQFLRQQWVIEACRELESLLAIVKPDVSFPSYILDGGRDFYFDFRENPIASNTWATTRWTKDIITHAVDELLKADPQQEKQNEVNSNLSALAQLQELQNLASKISWTITHSLGKLPGYFAHSEPFLSVPKDDTAWLKWRVRIFEDTREWDQSIGALRAKLAEQKNTLSDAILDIVGQSNFKYAKTLLSKSHEHFVKAFLPEPSARVWNEKSRDVEWLDDGFLQCGPEILRAGISTEMTSFCQSVLQSSDLMDCHCKPSLGNSSQSKLQIFLASLEQRVSEEFDAAKKLAMQNPSPATTPSPPKNWPDGLVARSVLVNGKSPKTQGLLNISDSRLSQLITAGKFPEAVKRPGKQHFEVALVNAALVDLGFQTI